MKARLLGKEIEFVYTQGMGQETSGFEVAALYVTFALKVLNKYPVDMLVFKTELGRMKIILSGYPLVEGRIDKKLDTVDGKIQVFSSKSLETPTFWLKIDDYGEEGYKGTFLLPSEY